MLLKVHILIQNSNLAQIIHGKGQSIKFIRLFLSEDFQIYDGMVFKNGKTIFEVILCFVIYLVSNIWCAWMKWLLGFFSFFIDSYKF